MIASFQLFPVEAVIERYELELPHSSVVSVFLQVLVSEPGEVRLVLRQAEGGHLQVSGPPVVIQHLHITYNYNIVYNMYYVS